MDSVTRVLTTALAALVVSALTWTGPLAVSAVVTVAGMLAVMGVALVSAGKQ